MVRYPIPALNLLGLFLASCLPLAIANTENVCTTETFSATCPLRHVIVVDTAEYGRMEAGRCGVTLEGGHVGCTNDVMSLADRKCSGRNQCSFIVGTSEFDQVNQDCMRELRAYLRISYSCVRETTTRQSQCPTASPQSLTSQSGVLASHVTDDTQCGSARSPWAINAAPGQIVNLTLVDFGALSRDTSAHYVTCRDRYGYVVEKSLNINESICGSTERRSLFYTSKSNTVEVHVTPLRQRRDDNYFLITYQVIGCSDLRPPAHAWYKRDGNTATIGCDDDENSWNLVCHGNMWEGVIGNCSVAPKTATLTTSAFPLNTVLVVAAIIGATVVLAVLAIVAGVVHYKKFKHDQETKSAAIPQSTLLYKTRAGTLTLPSTSTGTALVRGHVQYQPVACLHGHPSLPPHPHAQAQTILRAMTSSRGGPHRGPPQRGPPLPRGPPPSSSLGPGRPLEQIWEGPSAASPIGGDFDAAGPSESIYMNPSECSCTITKHRSPGGATADTDNDEDDISSYYAGKTGHKYYVLEKQAEQAEIHQQT